MYNWVMMTLIGNGWTMSLLLPPSRREGNKKQDINTIMSTSTEETILSLFFFCLSVSFFRPRSFFETIKVVYVLGG